MKKEKERAKKAKNAFASSSRLPQGSVTQQSGRAAQVQSSTEPYAAVDTSDVAATSAVTTFTTSLPDAMIPRAGRWTRFRLFHSSPSPTGGADKKSRWLLQNGKNRENLRCWLIQVKRSAQFPALCSPFHFGVTNHSGNDLRYPCDTDEDEHRSRTLISSEFDLLALSPDAGAHNDTLCNDTLDKWIPATVSAANGAKRLERQAV
ncbi:hypothetical protein K503DRAFT_858729 [Rhizopogon vinicolor AM-OR11-026]|uniref:Uncharacterized protein n=1 Tax=Rhizopogon vinicolor AM-OR11-026 TaxID=1314800 RepID=A0A1B7MRM6_9AGAM|nr:hypothetical protein K503DRAFT_858729 [Rhizopogon vinicolor AM-OR11-026]